MPRACPCAPTTRHHLPASHAMSISSSTFRRTFLSYSLLCQLQKVTIPLLNTPSSLDSFFLFLLSVFSFLLHPLHSHQSFTSTAQRSNFDTSDMDNSSNQQSFWQFSDQLRHHTSNLANLSLNDSIWSSNVSSKRPNDRINFDSKLNTAAYGWKTDKPAAVGKDFNYGYEWSNAVNVNELNGFDEGWKMNSPIGMPPQSNAAINGGFNKGLFMKPMNYHDQNNNNNLNVNVRGTNNIKIGKKSVINGNKKNSGDEEGRTDKRFKTLPPSESLPKHETVGGYIFVCNNDTMEENLKRQLFGLPPRYRDSVRQITPGLPLFLYNYSTHQLHGIFEAASFGGSNIDPTAWEDKKCLGESRFPAQVKVITRKVCDPLEENSFRPILHHYDGPKFRLELSIPEALSLLDIFADQDDNITGIQTPIEKL